jgi:hypothetical protein
MTDLDDLVREGLQAPLPGPDRTSERVVELHARVGRRTVRRRAVITAALAAVVVAGLVTAARQGDSRDAVVAGPGGSTTTTIATRAFQVGPKLRPEDVRLPDEGVAAFVEGVGVVLAGLDGHVYGHLTGFEMGWAPRAPGPVTLIEGKQWYLIDGGRVRPIAAVDGWIAWPLAYGAEQATIPGGNQTVVRRDGRQIFDMGNITEGHARVSYDRDVVSAGSSAIDLKTDQQTTLPSGCLVADRYGTRRYLVCDNPASNPQHTFLAGDESDPSPQVLLPPVDDGGFWSDAMASPDGTRLLLGWWSAACGRPQAYLAPSSGGPATPVERALGSDRSGTAITPMGWAPDGAVLVHVPSKGRCGAPVVAPGVYAIAADGTTRQVLPLPDITGGVDVAAWAPALR